MHGNGFLKISQEYYICKHSWKIVRCPFALGMGTIDILKSRQLSSQLLAQKVGRVNGQGNYFP